MGNGAMAIGPQDTAPTKAGMAVRGRETHSWSREILGCHPVRTPRRTSISQALVGMPLSFVEQLLRFVNLFDVLTRPFPEGKHRLA